mmetsp:Transcript_3587/g.5429  ORF Transcript_3587/g.5429 Transcript_3587/m.5429 type:complete len:443 (+) Transcript_3587:326-1654(+)
MTIPHRSPRRNYDRLPDDNGDNVVATASSKRNNKAGLNEPLAPSIYNPINIIVLDSAQTKFTIPCDATWTIAEFKKVSSTVHKIAPKSQRLIFMGKLLSDDSKTLKDYGVEEDGKIVHLFPKPNIVMVPSTSDAEGECGGNSTGVGRSNSSTGAHVPQIILDAEEANRQTQIRILSSHEIFEAQNRVKLLSFILLIWCSMELLTLFTIFLGVPADEPIGGAGIDDDGEPPGDPTDTSSHGGEGEVRPWRQSDYADMCISIFGFYVATLGIKATTENTLALARQYFVCLIIVGLAWNADLFYNNIRAQEDMIDRDNNGGDASDGSNDSGENGDEEINNDIYTNALTATILPFLVWLFCFSRAYHFQVLIRDAEREAEERMSGFTVGREDQEEEEVGITPEEREREPYRRGLDLEEGVGSNQNTSPSEPSAGDLELIVEQRQTS